MPNGESSFIDRVFENISRAPGLDVARDVQDPAIAQALTPPEDRPREPATLDELRESFSIDRIVAEAQETFVEVLPEPNILSSFGSGVATGILRPLEVFTGPPDEEIDPDHPIARTVGELGGILVSFVPIFAGTRMALAGVGLTKALVNYRTLSRVIEGALAFGVFEAGAGPPEGIPGRFGRGAMIGAGAELLFARMFPSKAIASRAGKTRKGQPISPEDVGVERNVHPGGTRDPFDMSSRIVDLAEPGITSDDILAQLSQVYRPGGTALIRNVTEPGRLIRSIKRTFPRVEVTVRAGGEPGVFELLLRDTRVLSEPRLIQRLLGVGRRRIEARPSRLLGTGPEAIPLGGERTFFLGGEIAAGLEKVVGDVRNLVNRGGPRSLLEAPTLSTEEAIKLIELDAFGETGIPVIKNLTGAEIVQEFTNITVEGSVLGASTFTPARIFTTKELGPARRFENVIHEFMHHVTRRFARGKLNAADEPDLARIVLGRDLTPVELAAVTRTGVGPVLRMEDIFTLRTGRISKIGQVVTTRDTSAERLMIEFSNATTNVIQRLLRTSKVEATQIMLADAQYYMGAEELIARMAQLMFLDPGAARKIAPRASRMVSGLIRAESPKMKMLLSKQEQRNVDDWFRFVLKEDIPAQPLDNIPFEEVPKLAAQFAREGGWPGMRIVVKGLVREWVRRVGQNVLTKDATGATELIPFSEVFRPVSATPRPSVLVGQTIRNVIQRQPNWVGVTLRDEANQGVRRAVIELENYEVIRGGQEGLGRWAAQNELTRDFTGQEVLARARDLGRDGVLLEDEGAYTAFIANRESLRVTEDVLYRGLVSEPSGNLTDDIIAFNFDNVAESLLREAGATERELPFFLTVARREYGNQLFELLDPEIRSAIGGLQGVVTRVTEDIETFVSRGNFKAEQIRPGRWRLREPDTGVEVFRGSEQEVRDFVGRSGLDDGAEDLISGQISSGMFEKGFGGGPPPKFQTTEFASPGPEERAGWLQGFLDQTSVLAPFLTSLETFSKAAENAGLGATFTKIFNPGQEAIARLIPIEMGATVREELGRTWNDQIRLIQDLVQGVSRDRFPFIKGWVEVASREEIAAGLLGKPMTEEMLIVARFFQKIGMDQEIPRLLSIQELARLSTVNKRQFLARAEELEASAPELAETIAELRAIAEDAPEGIAQVVEALNLSGEEKAGIRILGELLKRDKEDFSIYTVSRWLDAESVGPGRNARAVFAQANEMTEKELVASRALDDLLESVFSDSGLDASRQVKGFWPHWRKWAQQGFVLNRGIGKQLVPEESIAWADRAYRGGELGVYIDDPVVYGAKQVQNLMMKRHFDPRMPGMVEEVNRIREAGNVQLADVMNEYIAELRGRVHTSFERLNNAIVSFAEGVGIPVPKRHAQDIINSIVSTGYGAVIPFRVDFILRNYFQMVQMTPPRIGFKWFSVGAREAATQEGFQQAVQAGAVPVDAFPLFASTDITRIEAFRTLHLKLRRVFETGFRWYRKADDYGRAVAYLGYEARAKSFLSDFMAKRITWDQFLTRAKVRTFDPVDQGIFKDLFKEGRVQDAIDHLGVTLARETHFRYGHANHPAGWGNIYGRVFGQFGTWPVQYKDFLLQGAARGTTKDKIEFFGNHILVQLGLVAAGATVGINLWGFVSFNSLQYTGGPFADIAIDLVKAYNGTPAERAMARRSLRFLFPTLQDPRSIFVPGSYFLGDIKSALDDTQPLARFVLEAGGFRFFEPNERTGIEWLVQP